MLRNHHINKETQRPQLIVHILSGSAKPENRNQQSTITPLQKGAPAVRFVARHNPQV
jgi:hypothetical protein